MSLELCILASGSSGNCSVLRSPAGMVLIDCGIGPRTLAKRAVGTGIDLRNITAICLTHLDSDHFNPRWAKALHKLGINLYCHNHRRHELLEMLDDQFRLVLEKQVQCFNGAAYTPLPGLSFTPIGLAHDHAGSHGFLIEGFGCRIGYATDLGHVPAHLLERFCNLDVLAIESNYDPEMQLASGRPWFLKRRIMGGSGHLSNQQALAAVQQILDRHQRACGKLPHHIVLLHRSRQCNCPKLLRSLFEQDERIAPRLVLAEQYHRTEWLYCRNSAPLPGEQLTLGWG